MSMYSFECCDQSVLWPTPAPCANLDQFPLIQRCKRKRVYCVIWGSKLKITCLNTQIYSFEQGQQLSGMDPEPSNNLEVHAHSAFRKPSCLSLQALEAVAELEAYAHQLLSTKTKLMLRNCPTYGELRHPVAKALVDLVHSVITQLTRQGCKQCADMTSIRAIPISLFKTLCLMLQEGLFLIENKYECELLSSMVFQKGLVETLRICLLCNNNEGSSQPAATLLSYSQLDQILMSLLHNNYRKAFINNVYSLHSGNPACIERANFESTIKFIISNIGKVFTQRSNLITRNLKNVKKCRFIGEIVSSSTKIICNYKNEDFILEEVSKISEGLFENAASKLNKEQFQAKLQQILGQASSGPSGEMSQKRGSSNSSQFIVHTLWLYIDLLRVETLMLHDSELKPNIHKQKEITSSNFYTQEMQKLLKKCPYNGDECCDCKKCQCVRRNRESAKLSQEKKRNAVEQLDPMRKRIEQLERKNKQLEEENKILRSIVSQLKYSKSEFKSTIESVSKVLND